MSKSYTEKKSVYSDYIVVPRVRNETEQNHVTRNDREENEYNVEGL